ncbi:MAG: carboxypeptidase-like regulatory domain-containing protein [Bacteroidales bacterium]|jgi:hypothetical protein|nr:carboxypeptidase-like regulatory domain-containing protein [Bacteroidales bacterium]
MVTKTILLFVAFVALPFVSSTQSIERKVVDAETGLPVPFVTVLSSDKSIGAYADVDGVFSIDLKEHLTYTFSQIGYKPLSLSFQQLSSKKAIRMEALPLDLNPVVIKADAALRAMYRATDSTHKRMPTTPFYRRCYRQEVLQVNGKIVEDAKAIIDIEISRIFAPRRGTYYAKRLKGLEINIDGDTIYEKLEKSAPVCFFNEFIIGAPKEEKNVIFTRMSNDTTILFSYYPKPNYLGEKTYTSGRFTMNEKTMAILRIDQFIDSTTLVRHNNIARKYQYHKYTTCFYFTSKGIVSKIEYVSVYSLKENPDEIFTWTTTNIYKDLTKLEYQEVPSERYRAKKFLLEQHPVDMPDFESVFQQGFWD